LARALNFKRTAAAFAQFFRKRYFKRAGKICAGKRFFIFKNILQRAFGYHLAAVFTRAGTEVHYMVSLADGFLIVLHDDKRIAAVAQKFKGIKQAAVVAGMKAYGGLIQHIKNSGKPRAYLRGQVNALSLAAGQGFTAAVQRKVIKPHINKKSEPRVEFL